MPSFLGLSQDFQSVVSAFRLLPALRGFWPMAPVAAGGAAIDLSGHGERLEYNGAPLYNLHDEVVPYVALDGVSDSLSHADNALYDIVGTEAYIDPTLRGLTAGCWIRHQGLGSTNVYMAKYLSPPDASWLIAKDSGDAFRFSIVNASDLETVLSPNDATIGPWNFVVGRFEPGVAISIFDNTTKTTQATLKTSINNSGTLMHVGAADGGARLEGDICLCFLCAAALPDSLIGDLFRITNPLFEGV